MTTQSNNSVAAWLARRDQLAGQIAKGCAELLATEGNPGDFVDIVGGEHVVDAEGLASWRLRRLAAVGEMRELIAALAVEVARDALLDPFSGISQREVARMLRAGPSGVRTWVEQSEAGLIDEIDET